MLRLFLSIIILSFISFSAYSNPTYFPEKDSLFVQHNNAGAISEVAAEDVFEFLDVKEMYCGAGPHSFRFRSKSNITKESYITVRLILPNEDESYYIDGFTYKGNNTVEVKFSFNTYGDFTNGKSIKFVIKGDAYRSESKPFSLIMSYISPQTTSHCEDHTSTIDYAGKIPYDSISWSYNDSTIKGETRSSIKVHETGLYRATIDYKGCSATSFPHFIQKGVIPKIHLDYAAGSSICKAGSVSIFAKQDLGEKLFPYSSYQWELDGKIIESSKERTFNAKRPGNYTLTAFQGKCKATATAIKITQNSFLFNTIEFLNADSITTNNKYIVCKGQKVELQLKSLIKEEWQDPVYKTLIDTLLNSQGFKFQWKKDGKEIPGANKRDYSTDQPGRYILQIENGLCISNSNPLQVINSETIPMKLRTYRKDDCISKSIGIYYKIPLSYNIDLSEAEVKLFKYSTEQLKSNEIGNNLYIEQSGDYHVQIKINSSCSVLSDTISLKFHNSPPKIKVDTVYSCSEIVDLSNPSAYSGSKCEWTLNGVKLPFNGYSVKIDKPGLYSTTLSQECGPIFYFFVVIKKIKVNLDLFQESLTTCSERGTILRVFISSHNKFPAYKNEYPLKPYVKLYRYNNKVDEKTAKYQNAYDYSSFNFGYMAEFEIGDSGIYSAVVEEPGCETVSNSLKVDFRKLNTKFSPDIPDPDLCYNQGKITYQLENGPQRKFEWYKDSKIIPGFVSSSMDIYKPGLYYAKVEDNDCVSFSNRIAVDPYKTVPTAIISGSTIAEIGEYVDLKITFLSNPPFNYTLNNGDKGISQNHSVVHRIKFESPYTYKISSVKNACGEGFYEGEATIKVNVLANEPSIGRHIRIFPVPTTGSVEIEFDQLNRHELSFQVINMSGQVIISETKLSEPKKKLDLSHLVPGEYLIRMNVGKEVVTRKIIRQ